MIKKGIIIPDVHAPYHDKKAWKILIKAIQKLSPDILVILGDFLDNEALSFHPLPPGKIKNFDYEVSVANSLLDELDLLGATKKIYTFGNHEFRTSRYMSDRAPELHSMINIGSILRLKERGWQTTEYRDHTNIGKLHITHEAGSSGQYAHIKARNAFEASVVHGHNHQLAIQYSGNAKGETTMGCSLGWLGDVKTISYMHKINAAKWQHGFGVVYFEPGGNFHLFPTPIVNYRCIVEGNLISL